MNSPPMCCSGQMLTTSTTAANASVSLGVKLDEDLERKIAFWDDPDIPSREVNTTCERCGLRGCEERAAPPTLREDDDRKRDRAAALRELFETPPGSRT